MILAQIVTQIVIPLNPNKKNPTNQPQPLVNGPELQDLHYKYLSHLMIVTQKETPLGNLRNQNPPKQPEYSILFCLKFVSADGRGYRFFSDPIGGVILFPMNPGRGYTFLIKPSEKSLTPRSGK